MACSRKSPCHTGQRCWRPASRSFTATSLTRATHIYQSPASCDGVAIFRTYTAKGEVDLFIDRVLATQTGNLSGSNFDTHFDMSPNTYVFGTRPRHAFLSRHVSLLSEIRQRRPLQAESRGGFLQRQDQVFTGGANLVGVELRQAVDV
jgi:hypothetical protein